MRMLTKILGWVTFSLFVCHVTSKLNPLLNIAISDSDGSNGLIDHISKMEPLINGISYSIQLNFTGFKRETYFELAKSATMFANFSSAHELAFVESYRRVGELAEFEYTRFRARKSVHITPANPYGLVEILGQRVTPLSQGRSYLTKALKRTTSVKDQAISYVSGFVSPDAKSLNLIATLVARVWEHVLTLNSQGGSSPQFVCSIEEVEFIGIFGDMLIRNVIYVQCTPDRLLNDAEKISWKSHLEKFVASVNNNSFENSKNSRYIDGLARTVFGNKNVLR